MNRVTESTTCPQAVGKCRPLCQRFRCMHRDRNRPPLPRGSQPVPARGNGAISRFDTRPCPSCRIRLSHWNKKGFLLVLFPRTPSSVRGATPARHRSQRHAFRIRPQQAGLILPAPMIWLGLSVKSRRTGVFLEAGTLPIRVEMAAALAWSSPAENSSPR